MKKYLITYGNDKFRNARETFVRKSEKLGVFDNIHAYSEKDVTRELASSDIFNESRGGGYWSWKPDIIHSALLNAKDGDIIVYCDAGCTIQLCGEWKRIWKRLANHDIYAQRLFQRTEKWTKRALVDFFRGTNGPAWEKQYQFLATVIIIKASPFSRMFIDEWRDMMINHPELADDVSSCKRYKEKSCFIENRHDQAIYSALIYKYLHTGRIYECWEHVEDLDIFSRQAIRATRLRNGEREQIIGKIKQIGKRIIKNFILKPLFYAPSQLFYSRANK